MPNDLAPEPDSPTLLALRLLEVVLDADDAMGVSEIGRKLEVSRARAHRHVTQLAAAGYLRRRPDAARYEPGWRLVLMGQRIQHSASAVRLATPHMEQLREVVRQTVVFSQLTEEGVTVTKVLPGDAPIDIVLNIGTQFGYNSSAQGKVALAFASPEQLRVWSRLVDENRTPATIRDHQVLWDQVADIREVGWATAPGETYRGINTVAAPVLGSDGYPVGTLAVVASDHYLADPPPQDVVDALTGAAARLSADLGHQVGTHDAARS